MYAGLVRAAFIFLVLLLLVAMAVPVTIGVQLWMDGSSVIQRAERSGALRAAAVGGRLTMAERTIAMDEFHETWRMRAIPCRTLAFLWADISTSDRVPPAMPVSQRLATALMPDRRGTSVRWQLNRFVVACQLERRFDDRQLLRAWLATANFGSSDVGLESAAHSIFQKASGELNAEESARLAALLRSPSLRNEPDRWARHAQSIEERVAARAR